jgi:hypothetical protein
MAAWAAAPPSIFAEDVVVETTRIELRINDLRAALAGQSAVSRPEQGTIRRLENEIRALSSHATCLRACAAGGRVPARAGRL